MSCLRQFVEVVESYIPLELEFFNLLTNLRAVYDSWLRQMASSRFNTVSITGTLSGALREVRLLSHSQTGMDLVCYFQWLSLFHS